jgi:hypothetical protein
MGEASYDLRDCLIFIGIKIGQVLALLGHRKVEKKTNLIHALENSYK